MRLPGEADMIFANPKPIHWLTKSTATGFLKKLRSSIIIQQGGPAKCVYTTGSECRPCETASKRERLTPRIASRRWRCSPGSRAAPGYEFFDLLPAIGGGNGGKNRPAKSPDSASAELGSDGPFMKHPSGFHVLCSREDLEENGSRGFEVNGVALFAVRKRGAVFVYRNRCPHVGLPLNWLPNQFLDLDRELIQCTSHGALFRIDNGQCVAGPCPGQSLRAISHREVDGEIHIELRDLED